MSRILVTGGAGFIASHVADAFVKAGHTVAVLDNLSTGKKENIPAQARFFHADIIDKDALDAAFAEFKPEVVDHHAAQISVGRSVENPLFDAEQNVIGLLKVLELAKKYGVARIIFVSSAGVYGDAQDIPLPEKTPLLPLSPYAITKASGEHYVRFFDREHGLEAVILRYANVYGPRQDPYGEAGVVAIFTEKALAGETCYIFGNGKQTRDFVFVKDIAQANLLALEGKPGTYNVGSGKETSINALFAEFKGINGKLDVAHDEARPGEVFRSVLDAGLAGKDLDWQPRISLTDGIRETYEWFKRQSFQGKPA